MIDIIIPVYNSKETLFRTLASIECQSGIEDVKLYIIDDNSTDNYDDILSEFKNRLDINYFKLEENHGPGYAREYGLEKSSSKYIIFLDSDDIFFTNLSINALYSAISDDYFDVVRSVIYEEDGNGEYNIYKNENIGLHGKIYKRSFLEENNIHFNDTRSNEDVGFNALIKLCNAKYCDIDEVTYLWCNNDKSITRNNKENYKNIDLENYAYNMYWAYEEAVQRGFFNEYYILETIIELYNRILQSDKEETKNIIKEYANKLFEFLGDINNEELKNKIIENGFLSYYDSSFIMNAFNNLFDISIEFEESFESEEKSEWFQAVYTEEEQRDREYHLDLMNKFNYSNEQDPDILSKMFGSIGFGTQIIPPFYADWGGKNVYIGDGCYLNFGISMVDDGNIYIGNNVLIGPNVNILTVNHPVDVRERLNHMICIKDIIIGDNVWIGAGAIILPGVTIGENSVIGAGSIVTKDIPPNVIAVGNPCKVIKKQEIV